MSKRQRKQTDDAPISAQVVLKARLPSGEAPTAVTAENIASLMPAADVIATVTAEFRRRGFDLGPVVGLSFAITARPSVFEETFGTTLPRGRDGRVDTVRGGEGLTMRVAALPEPVRRHVEAVVFPPPPDFGPVRGGW